MTEDLSVAAIELDSDNEDYEQLEKHPLLKDFVKKKESLNNKKSPIVAIDEDMGEQVEVKKESSNDESTEGKVNVMNFFSFFLFGITAIFSGRLAQSVLG